MIGFPTETEKDLMKTLWLYDEILRINPIAEINGVFIYTPFPGTEMFEEAVEYGFRPPETLEEWGNWRFSDNRNNPWFNSSYRRRLKTISNIARYKYFSKQLGELLPEKIKMKLGSSTMYHLYRLFGWILDLSADFRWKKRFFALPLEWEVWSNFRERVLESF